MNEKEEFGYGSEIHDIVSGTTYLLREASNITQNIATMMHILGAIKRKYEGEKISKGDYELEGKVGTIYDRYESNILKHILDVKTKYWNPNWDFISWEELFSKIDKIIMILNDIKDHKDEFENILLRSEEIKIRLDTIFKYQLGQTKT